MTTTEFKRRLRHAATAALTTTVLATMAPADAASLNVNFLARIKTQDAAGTGGISADSDLCGMPVAVHGNVMVLGCSRDDAAGTTWSDGGATDAGAAYVIRAPGGDWGGYVIDAYLKESSLGTGGTIRAGNLFGETIAIGATGSGGALLAISAPRIAVGALGKVYVYALADLSGSQPTGITWKDTLSDSTGVGNYNREYGRSLRISGRNLFVGVPNDNASVESANGTDNNPCTKVKGQQVCPYQRSGAVYVYYDGIGDGSGYPASVPTLKLKHRTDANAVSPIGQAQFGYALDYDGSALIVGNKSNTVDGAAVFTSLSAANWAAGVNATRNLPTPVLGTNAGPAFYGQAVAIEGSTAVVGAPRESTATETSTAAEGNQSGSVYVFHSSNGNSDWSNVQLLRRLKAKRNDSSLDPRYIGRFGWSVDIIGSTIAVGSSSYDPTSTFSSGGSAGYCGATYLFEDTNLTSPTGQSGADIRFAQFIDYTIDGAYYGRGTFVSGDYFGHGVVLDDSTGPVRLFISAPGESSSSWNSLDNATRANGEPGYRSGAVFVYGQ